MADYKDKFDDLHRAAKRKPQQLDEKLGVSGIVEDTARVAGDAARRGAARCGLAGAGSARRGAAGAASVRVGSARGGSARDGSVRAGSGAGVSAISGSAGRILARPLPCVPDFFLRAFFGSAAPGVPVADEDVNLSIVSSTQSRFLTSLAVTRRRSAGRSGNPIVS